MKTTDIFDNNTNIIGYIPAEINRIEQLLLHAGLGAITAKLTNNDMLSGAVAGVMGEVAGEYAGNKLYDKDYNFTEEQKNTLKEIGSFAGGLGSMFTGLVQGQYGQELTDNIYNGQRIGKNAVENNYVLHAARDLNGKFYDLRAVIGNHSFNIFVPDNPEDFTAEDFTENGLNYIPPIDLGNGIEGWIMGAYFDKGNLSAKFNEETDQKALQNYFNNGNKSTGFPWDFDVEIKQIESIDQLNDTQFGYNMIKYTQNYINNTNTNPVPYSLIPICGNGYNCNSFSNTLLNVSGAKPYNSSDFKGTDLGRNQIISPEIFYNQNKQTNWINNQFYIDINDGKLPSVFNNK